MRASVLLLAMVLVLSVTSTAMADWDPTDLSKWVQMPDLDYTGMDVFDSNPNILADDFECREYGPITDIHIWGSWYHDVLPETPDNVSFTLSIHADIPASQSPTGYSMPGAVLWVQTFQPGTFAARLYAENLNEGWYEPPDYYEPDGDSQCWQYNFFIDEAEAFIQEGGPDTPVVYWLDVQAHPHEPGAYFGWKTSVNHWNDDAVWVQGTEPYLGDWNELRYPFGHPYQGDSIDLAFVITTEDTTQYLYDYGDAPDGPYPTLNVNGGAFHQIVPQIYLGNMVDPEPDGQPDPNALGDDLLDMSDDEDGVLFMNPIVPGGTADIAIKASVAGFVDGYIDWMGDGSWAQPQDYVLVTQAVNPGWQIFSVPVPAATTVGTITFARFRYSTYGGLSFAGGASDGEVEDYQIMIDEPYGAKWIQYPDITQNGIDVNCTEPFLLADDFLCESPGRVTEIHVWGSWLGDWLPYGGDPWGAKFTLSIHEDIPASETGTYSMPGEVLWIRDFQPGEFIAEIWRDQIEEGWLDPPDYYMFPADWTCWHYIFQIPPEEAFHQVGMPDSAIVYWLDVQAQPLDVDAFFGWKTSYEHWNDDAVWGDGMEPYMGPWFELRYPSGHAHAGHSIDLAFAIRCDYGTGVDEPEMPKAFSLRPNVPNPFNPSTVISYNVPADGGHVTIEVFDVAGRLVETLVDDVETPGVKNVVWDGRDSEGRELASGVYFCRMTAPKHEESRKMLLLK